MGYFLKGLVRAGGLQLSPKPLISRVLKTLQIMRTIEILLLSLANFLPYLPRYGFILYQTQVCLREGTTAPRNQVCRSKGQGDPWLACRIDLHTTSAKKWHLVIFAC